MKFAVASEHRNYFQKHQMIEFQGVLNENQIQQLQNGIEGALSKRLKISDIQVRQLSAEKQFLSGRDLWRSDDKVKKITLNTQLVEIASELVERRSIRLGYDQFLPTPAKWELYGKESSSYANLLGKPSALEDVSCLQGILCGLMICLKDAAEQISEDHISIFPARAGNGVYFTAGKSIDFPELKQRLGQKFFLIAFTDKNSVYVMKEGDPHGHALKNLGYVFGDRLNDKTHPVLLR